MEQRRFSGKGHWYHETQSNHSQTDVLPLVPEAANVDDRFLLDLELPEKIVTACHGWLAPARALCHLLFPLNIEVNRLHTQCVRQTQHGVDGRSGVWRSATL